MAAIATLTVRRDGNNSVSYTTTAGSGGADTISNAELAAAALNAGSRIKAFLTATYVDEAAVNLAWTQQGGNWSGTNISSFRWVASNSTPSLAVVTVAAAVCSLRLALAYSASE